MLVCYPGLGSVEKPSERRGYWDPRKFPTVAAFAALPRTEQDEVADTCKRQGFRFAVEIVPRRTISET